MKMENNTIILISFYLYKLKKIIIVVSYLYVYMLFPSPPQDNLKSAYSLFTIFVNSFYVVMLFYPDIT